MTSVARQPASVPGRAWFETQSPRQSRACGGGVRELSSERARHTAIQYRPPPTPVSVTRRLDWSLRLPTNQPCAPSGSGLPLDQHPDPAIPPWGQSVFLFPAHLDSPDRSRSDSTANPTLIHPPAGQVMGHGGCRCSENSRNRKMASKDSMLHYLDPSTWDSIVLPGYSLRLEITARVTYDHLETMGLSRGHLCVLPITCSV